MEPKLGMDKQYSHSTTTHISVKSPLKPEQLRVQLLWQQCGVKVDARTFQQLWRLCDLGIPPNVVLALMNDIAKYSIKPV